MAEVKRYFAGKLPSARTPIVSADKSGQIIGNSIAQVAGDLIGPILKMAEQQQAVLNESQRVKTMGEFSSEILSGSDSIKKSNIQDPTKAVEALQGFRNSVKDKYLSGVENDRLRQSLSLDFERFDADQKIHDVSWQIQQTGLLTQQNYLDRINSDAKFLSSTDNYQDYLEKTNKLIADRDNYNMVFGIGKGDETVNKGLESYTKGFIYNQLDQGKSFEAAQLLMQGKFDPFITADTKRDLLEGVDKAQKGAQTRSEFMRAAQSVTEMFGASGAVISGDIGIADIEEKLSQTGYDLVNAQKNNASASEVRVLRNQQEMLQNLRNAKLESISSTAIDDIETKGELLAQYNTLVKYDKPNRKSGPRNTLTGTLMAISDFQRDATKAYYEGKLTSATYASWMEYSRAAIAGDIEANLKTTKKGFQADNKTLSKLADKTPDGKRVRKTLTQILRNADTKDGRSVAVDTMDFFLDDLNDQTGGDLSQMKNLGDKTLDEMVSRAKLKSRLKSMGYPVYLTVGDQIPTSAGLFTISGNDADGMPLVDVTKVNVGK
jgi:hypothetical protein